MIFHGDCLEKLKALEDSSIDFVCTDPPYGYLFMGKQWDKAVPSVEIWQECLRVLKPGAFINVMSAPRSDVLSRMIVNIEDAGFRVDFTPIYWTYASGFPKAGNIGKLVDKRNGVQNSDYWGLAKYLKDQREKLGYSKTQMDEACGIKSSYYKWEGAQNGDLRIPAKAHYLILKNKLQLDDRYNDLVNRIEAEREVVGRKKSSIGGETWRFMEGRTDVIVDDFDITIAKTAQAKALDGSYAGFQPKPAVEVIIVAMKPLSEKTYVDQALANRHGISWLDDARIPTGEFIGRDSTEYDKQAPGWNLKSINKPSNPQGRFPANLLVSDDVLNDGENRKSGWANKDIAAHDNSVYELGLQPKETQHYGDSGSYSRYFDLDKWATTLPFLITPKASRSEKNKGLDGFEEKAKSPDYRQPTGNPMVDRIHGLTKKKNHHPTVKPLKLMSYLITLFSRPGDTVLDPFVGSGTTCVAAHKLGRKYIGIEKEVEYVDIARARLNSLEPQLL